MKQIDREQVNYYINDKGTMFVYYGERLCLFEMSDCKAMSDDDCNDLIDEVLTELDYKY